MMPLSLSSNSSASANANTGAVNFSGMRFGSGGVSDIVDSAKDLPVYVWIAAALVAIVYLKGRK